MTAVDLIEISDSAVNVPQLLSFAGDAKAGAISTFIGTTRDNYTGKSGTLGIYERGGAKSFNVVTSSTLDFQSMASARASYLYDTKPTIPWLSNNANYLSRKPGINGRISSFGL